MKQHYSPSLMSIACSTSSTSPAHPISMTILGTTSEQSLPPSQESPSSTTKSHSRSRILEIIGILWISGKLHQLLLVQLDNFMSQHSKQTIIPSSQLNTTPKKIFINGMFLPVELHKEFNSPKFYPTNSLSSQERTLIDSLPISNSRNPWFTISSSQRQTSHTCSSTPSRSPAPMTGLTATPHWARNDLSRLYIIDM